MPETRFNAEEELHKTILQGAVGMIRNVNPNVPEEIAIAFTQGYLYNASYEVMLGIYAMDIIDAFFMIYSKHGKV